MCGIAGLFRPKADLPGDALEAAAGRMADTLRQRGPDGSGTWIDAGAGIALAHRRLAVIDPSPAGRQPMTSASGRWVLTFNGEIYNFDELRRHLAARGHGFRGRSDTEVLLAAVEEWGVEAALPRLEGMFALALWDRQERALHLARDRIGEKPLYYGWSGGVFLFGSELKALRAYEGWQGRIDRTSVALLLRHNFVPGPHSIYAGVSKLPPASIFTIDSADPPREYLSRYWSLNEAVNRGLRDRFTGTEADATDRLEQLLRASVQRQTRADVPVGAFLSGGIDSSTIAALMQAQSARPIKTFTVGFDEPGYDESAPARAIARHLGTEHHELRVTADTAVAVIPGLPALYDEPFADSSQIPTYLLASLAREHVTVALAGDGGDELFGGYHRYFLACAIWQRLAWLPVPVRALMAQALASFPPAGIDRVLSGLARLLPQLALPAHTGDRLNKGAELLRARSADDLYTRLISYWRPAPLVNGARPASVPSPVTSWPVLADFAERMMAIDATGYLPDDLLTKLDRACMAVSLEPRCPYLDPSLIEFAWRLPPAWKVRNGQGKWLLRGVLQRYVPRELTQRPKMGFGVPLAAWLRGPLREWAEAQLAPARLRAGGFLEAEPIRKKWQEHLRGTRNWQYHLWGALMFQAWLEHERRAAPAGERAAPILLHPTVERRRRRVPATVTPERRASRGRLLFLVNNPRYFLSHRLPLALGARAAGFEVWVAAPEGEAAREVRAHGLNFHPVPMSRWGSHPGQELRTFLSIFRLLRALRPDLLHAVTIKPVLYGCLAARLAGVPGIVAAIPGMSQIFSRPGWWAAIRRRLVTWGYRQALGKANVRVIFQNPDDWRELVTGKVIGPGNAVLIRGAGVDLKRFFASPLPEGTPVVACVARMLTSKGIGEFVAAAATLKREGVRARFVLVGDREQGNPSSVSRTQLERWCRSGVVEWWGHRDDIPRVLAQAYLVCLPSYREGLPKVLLEAAAAGRPIVTTDVPGCREVVRDGENGFTVPAHESERLARAIAEVLRDRRLAQAMGARSRVLAEREFGYEKVVRRTLGTYDSLLPPNVGLPRAPEPRPRPEAAPGVAIRAPAPALARVRPAGVASISR